MRRPVLMTATLTAVGLALAAPAALAQSDASNAPVDLVNPGADVSVRSSGADSQAGYFVSADGSIQYRDEELEASSVEVTPVATPVAATEPMIAEPVIAETELAEPVMAAPLAANVFDAAPAPTAPVTLDGLRSAFADDTETAMEPVAFEDVTIDASAPVADFYAAPAAPVMQTLTASDSYGYAVESSVAMDASVALSAPVTPVFGAPEPVAETYAVTVTQPAAEPLALAPLAPAYAEPVMAQPMIAETFPVESYAEPSYAEPVYAEPVVAQPAYGAPAPVTISTVAPAPVLPAYASLEPAPRIDAAPSGLSYAQRGDGSYGRSEIKTSGDGLAGQETTVYVSKSTIVELPVDAHEIFVSDPTQVRAVLRTARQMVLIGLKAGLGTVTAFDERGRQILNLDINVSYDLRPLKRALDQQFPNRDIQIERVLGETIVSGATGGVSEAQAIRDFVRRYIYSAQLAAGVAVDPNAVEFIDRLTTTSDDQVLVKVRIAEMRRSVIKQFGVDFNLATDAAIGAATGTGFSPFTDFGNITNAFGVNGTALGGIAANIAGSFGDTNFGALVRAFERHNVMRVLAEPTLTAVSGETASFLAGGQFAFPQAVDRNGNVSFSFRDFGVALEFTPVVVGSGRISLTIATEISELTTEGAVQTDDITLPGISVRRANTTVELPSGGTMSIAGMLLQRDASSHLGLPGLKNLPVLGQLFSSSDFQKEETELVILVTPYVVKPGQEKEFRLPTDGFAPASDFDFYILGRLHKVYGAGDQNMASAKEALKAPFGFILD